MKAEAVIRKSDDKKADEVVKCGSCERTLKSDSEWVRSRKSVMCASCYESLLNPFAKCCSGGALL
jgi:protein-arginine kinase activator protein McsA